MKLHKYVTINIHTDRHKQTHADIHKHIERKVVVTSHAKLNSIQLQIPLRFLAHNNGFHQQWSVDASQLQFARCVLPFSKCWMWLKYERLHISRSLLYHTDHTNNEKIKEKSISKLANKLKQPRTQSDAAAPYHTHTNMKYEYSKGIVTTTSAQCNH